MKRAGWGPGVVLAMVCAANVSAQDKSGIAPVTEPSQSEIAREDPFGLQGIAKESPEVTLPEAAFRPAETRPDKIPEMKLRGIGRMEFDAAPTALLDIEGYGLFIVSVNDTISLQGLQGDNVMRIVKISEISVTVEAGSFGELIVVR